ncbi:MAG: hypothetical protein AAFN18_11845 [Cyanobacteria bacterium J06554_6]
MSFSDYDTWKLAYPPHWDEPEDDAEVDDPLAALDYEPDPVPWWMENNSVWAVVVRGWLNCQYAARLWWKLMNTTNNGGLLWVFAWRAIWFTLAPEYQANNAWSAPWEEEPPF